MTCHSLTYHFLRAFLFSLCLIFTTSVLDSLSTEANESETRKKNEERNGRGGGGKRIELYRKY